MAKKKQETDEMIRKEKRKNFFVCLACTFAVGSISQYVGFGLFCYWSLQNFLSVMDRIFLCLLATGLISTLLTLVFWRVNIRK